MHASPYGFNYLYVLKYNLRSHVLIHVCPRKLACAIRGYNLKKKKNETRFNSLYCTKCLPIESVLPVWHVSVLAPLCLSNLAWQASA